MVDASALAAFVLKEPGWKSLAEYLVGAVSVDMVVKEVANAVWKACRVRGYVGVEEARRLLRVLKSMIGVNIELRPEADYLDAAFEIAVEHGVTVYDALYLALAVEEGEPLLTLDERQLRVAGKLGVRVVEVRL